MKVPRVLLDTREKHFTQNPYIQDLTSSVTGVEMDGFTWRRLLFGRYDVVHVHWPEWLVEHSRPPFGWAMRFLMTGALVRLRMTGTPILRTVHNRKPHADVTAWGARLIANIEAQANRRIWLSVLDDQLKVVGPNDRVIPHPDYEPLRRRLGVSLKPPPRSGRGLCFGSLAPYRRFEEVAHAAAASNGTLTIIGSAIDDDYTSGLELLARASNGRIEVRRGRIDDTELVGEIQASDVVFVPYEDLYNSGVVFLSLTMQRPVALRAGPASDRLAAEYGGEWIRRWSGTLDRDTFDAIVNAPAPTKPARSAQRDWSAVASDHRDVYRSMTSRDRQS